MSNLIQNFMNAARKGSKLILAGFCRRYTFIQLLLIVFKFAYCRVELLDGALYFFALIFKV